LNTLVHNLCSFFFKIMKNNILFNLFMAGK
jgi:hypothetical protein